MLTIGGEKYEVRPEVREALLNYSHAYRLGSIGPDGFPDLVGAQMTTHPGVPEKPGGWVTDDWLRWVMGHAERPEEVAFAYGYLTHAASDVFAHTYVNTYAGDFFSFADEQEVELRHMALENFILEHQPPLLDFTQTEIYDAYYVNLSDELAGWLADTLILNEEVAHQYGLVAGGVTVYLKKIYDYWKLMDSIITDARKAQADLKAGLDSLKDRISSLKKKKVKISLGWLGSIKVKLWPWYCFIDPGTCVLITTTWGSLEITKDLLDVSTDLGLKPLLDWRDQIRAAVVAYCRASRDVATEILRDKDDYQRPPYPAERDPTKPLKEWAICWGPAFAGVPSEVTTSVCLADEGLQSLLSLKDRYRSWELDLTEKLGRFEWIVAPHNAMTRVRANINELLEEEFSHIGQDIAGEDSVIYDMIELREEKDLAEIFRADSSDKKLLLLPDIKERIMADMRISSEDEFWDPDEYPVVAYAITLSKLLLLDAAELNRLALHEGVNCSIYGETPFVSEPDFNLLFGWIRSIDGNQQWQPYALPYPRRNETGMDDRGPDKRHFGYYFGEMARSDVANYAAQTGFPLWQDQGLHEKVFLKLFDRPLLARELLPEGNPAASTPENPFPKSIDEVQGNVIHAVEDCINTYVLKSTSETDLVFRFPELLSCIPDEASATNVRYRWDFIDDVVERRYAQIPLEESLTFDRSASHLWTWTNLFGVVQTFEGSLDELALQQEQASLRMSETQAYDQNSGQMIVSFHVRKVILGFNAAASEGVFYPPNNLVDLPGNMICDRNSESPAFIKGPRDELLLQVTTTWDDRGLQQNSCVKRYRIIEFRDPSLDYINKYYQLGHLGSPCDIPANIVEPASGIDLKLMQLFRDESAPVFSRVRDFNFDYDDHAWRAGNLAVPSVIDDWYRSAELNVQNDAPEEFPLGTTTVHWTATDPNGNLTTVAQKITVADTEPPQFLTMAGLRTTSEGGDGRPGGGGAGPGSGSSGGVRPEDYDLGIVELLQENEGVASIERLTPPRAVDNYPGEVSVFLEDPEDTYTLGDSVVTWVARDASGNETRADQLIRVTSLPGDTDLDGDVDDDDAAIIELGLGERALGYGEVTLEDFNEDGVVDTADEQLRDEIQAHIDSITVDLRDLNEDDWITEEDAVLLKDLMTPQASFSLNTDFSLLPPQATLLGEAVLNQERLELSSSQIGSLLIIPASQVRKVTGLEMSFTFQRQLGARPPAMPQGLSMNFAPDLPGEAFGEEGAGSGLRISLDLGLFIRDQPRTMRVWYNDLLLGTSDDLNSLISFSQPVRFVLRIKPDGTISIWLNDDTEHLIFDNLPGYEATVGQFGLGARFSTTSGGYLWIDDLTLQATYEPPLLSLRLSYQLLPDGNLYLHLHGSPSQQYHIEVSDDLRSWNPWQDVTVPSDQTEVDLDLVEVLGQKAHFYRAWSQY